MRIRVCSKCGNPFTPQQDEDICGCIDSTRKLKSARSYPIEEKDDGASPGQENAIRELEDGLSEEVS